MNTLSVLKYCLFSVLLFINISKADSDAFSLIILPDTQYYSESYPDIFYAQTKWISQNLDSFDVKMVIHVGDLVNTSTPVQWQVAVAAMDTLFKKVPVALNVGNHDYDHNTGPAHRSTRAFNAALSHFAEQPSIIDHYEPYKLNNTAQEFYAAGTHYLVLNLEFGPNIQMLQWANQVIENYPTHKVIIVTHCYLKANDERAGKHDRFSPNFYNMKDGLSGEEIWEEFIRQHENIFLVLCGHMLGDGIGTLVSTGDNGNQVAQLLANYQMQENGGNGFLRIMQFHPAGKTIDVSTYSPTLNAYDTNPENQFSLSPFPDAFTPHVPPEIDPFLPFTFSEDESLLVDSTELLAHINNHSPEDVEINVRDGKFVTVERHDTKFRFKSPRDWFGTDSCTLIAINQAQLSDTAKIPVDVISVNDAPVWAELPDVQIPEDSSVTLNPRPFVSDVDHQVDELRFAARVIHFAPVPDGHLAGERDLRIEIDPRSGDITFSSSRDSSGIFQVELQAVDPENAVAIDTLSVTIEPQNDPPKIDALPHLTVAEDDSLMLTTDSLLQAVHDPDHPHGQLNVSLQNGEFVTARDHENGWILQPEPNGFGVDSLQLDVSDPHGLTDAAFLHITVTSVNDAPVWAELPDVQIPEDSSVTLNPRPFVSDVDHQVDELRFAARVIHFAPVPDGHLAGERDLRIEIDPRSGDITFSSSRDSSGIFQVELQAVDPENAVAIDTLSVTIEPINDPPQIDPLPVFIFSEDQTPSIPIPIWKKQVSDAESPFEDLVWEFENGRYVQARLKGKNLILQPTANWFGRDTLAVRLCDPDSGQSSSVLPLWVHPVNDPPILTLPTDSMRLHPDSSFVLPLWDYASDVETPQVNLTVGIKTPPVIQHQFDQPSGHLTLIPDHPAGPVFDWLRVSVSDSAGATVADSVWLTLYPTGVRQRHSNPETFAVQPPYPNPFNPAMRFSVFLSKTETVDIAVFNAAGRQVDIVHAGRLDRGTHIFNWPSHRRPSGVYFLLIQTPSHKSIQKCVLLQ